MNLSFDFYGLEVEVLTSFDELKKRLSDDFLHFQSHHELINPLVTVQCFLQSFDHTFLPQTVPFIQNDKVIAYRQQGKKYYNYHYEGLVVEDLDTKQVRIYSENIDRLHELTYLYILSLTGKQLDFKAIHKIHGMALSYPSFNLLFLAPSKGGKSTIFLELLNSSDDVSFFSDDTPLIGQDGLIHPFPLRIGLNHHAEKYCFIQQEKVYTLQRKEYGKKVLVPVSGVIKKVAKTNCKPNIVLIGKRANFKYVHFSAIGFKKSFIHLMEHLIIGLGLPMIAEFFITHSLKDYPDGIKILFSRLKAAYSLTRNGKFYEVWLTENPVKNAKEIERFLKNEF